MLSSLTRVSSSLLLPGCADSLVTVSFTFGAPDDSDWSKVICILGLASYLAFFSTGLGPGNWVVVSEVFATSIRAKAMSIAVFPKFIASIDMARILFVIGRYLHRIVSLFVYLLTRNERQNIGRDGSVLCGDYRRS
jgi:hypothetical protein